MLWRSRASTVGCRPRKSCNTGRQGEQGSRQQVSQTGPQLGPSGQAPARGARGALQRPSVEDSRDHHPPHLKHALGRAAAAQAQHRVAEAPPCRPPARGVQPVCWRARARRAQRASRPVHMLAAAHAQGGQPRLRQDAHPWPPPPTRRPGRPPQTRQTRPHSAPAAQGCKGARGAGPRAAARAAAALRGRCGAASLASNTHQTAAFTQHFTAFTHAAASAAPGTKHSMHSIRRGGPTSAHL